MKNKHFIIILLTVAILAILFVLYTSIKTQQNCENISIFGCKNTCGVCPDNEVSSIMSCHSKGFCGENCLRATNQQCTSYTQCVYSGNKFGVCVDKTCFISCSA